MHDLSVSASVDERTTLPPDESRAPPAEAASPALIFRVEDVFTQVRLDYSTAMPAEIPRPKVPKNPFQVVDAARAKMPPQQYEALVARFEASAKRIEEEALRMQNVPAPTAKAIRSLSGLGFKLVAYSSFDESVARSFLSRSGLITDFDYVWARTRLNGDVVVRLTQGFVANHVEARRSIFFSGRPQDVKAVKAVGPRVVLLPNRNENGQAQLLSQPDAYIVNLEEASTMLALPTWRLQVTKESMADDSTTSQSTLV